MKLDPTKALLAYTIVTGTALGGFAVSKAVGQPRVQAFDTIDVQRIDLREPDGTLRMVASNRDHAPGLIVKGKEYPHPTRAEDAGLLFFDDEATEDGGLLFHGRMGADGKPQTTGHLSFDQYRQDQVLTLDYGQEGGGSGGGLVINDYPDRPFDVVLWSRANAMKDGPQKQALLRRLEKEGGSPHMRASAGADSGFSAVTLRDAAGHVRLLMKVSPAGDASIDFIDAGGKVVRSVTSAG